MFKCFKNDLSPYIRDYDKDPLSSIPDVMPRKYIKKGLSITSAISEEMKDTDPNKYSRFIRRQAKQFCDSKLFQYSIGILIVLNQLVLIFGQHPESEENTQYDILPKDFTQMAIIIILIIYWLEIIVQVIANGFYSEDDSFLSDFHNGINLVVTVASSIFFYSFAYYLTSFRVFYLFRYFTTWQMFYPTKQLLSVYRQAIKQIITILIILIAFCLLFAIIGVNLWSKDMHNRCHKEDDLVTDSPLCSKNTNTGYQCSYDQVCKDAQVDEIQFNYGITNFDNLGKAYITLFQTFYIEGWGIIMYNISNGTNPYIAPIYFGFFFTFCTYFLSNLLVAIFLRYYNDDNYSNEEKQNKKLKIKCRSQRSTLNEQRIRQFCWMVHNSQINKLIINTMIVINMIFLSISSYPSPSEDLLEILYIIQFVMILIFVMEDIVGIIGSYKQNFNFILILFMIDIISLIHIINIQSMSFISAFKAINLFTIMHSNYLVQAIKKSVMQLINIFFIFFFGLITATLIAQWLYYGKIQSRSNFNNIAISISTMQQIVLGDNWNYVWYDCLRNAPSWYGYLFFIGVLFVGKTILMNSFLTLILTNFIGQPIVYKNHQKIKPLYSSVTMVRRRNFQSITDRLCYYFNESSLCIFHRNSYIRKSFQWLIENKYYDRFILILIMISSIVLALDEPLMDQNTTYKKSLSYIDITCTACFIAEMLINIIASGLIYNYKSNHYAYLRNPWNILDSFVVITSIIELFNSNQSLKALKSLRVLRVLKTIMISSKNEQMKLIISALFHSITQLGNIFMVLGVLIWIMAITCMYQYKGAFHYKIDGQWTEAYNNFDNILNAIIEILKTIQGENWMYSMILAVDHQEIGKDPKVDNNRIHLWFYMLILFVNNIIIWNILIGVVVNNFWKLKEQQSGYAQLNSNEKKWVVMQRIMLRKSLLKIVPKPDEAEEFKRLCYTIENSKWFEILFDVLILINLIILSINNIHLADQYVKIIYYFNLVFLILFALEAFIKIKAKSLQLYFNQGWNQFDFLLVLIHIIIVIIVADSQIKDFSVIPIVLRGFRFVKFIRFIKSKVIADSIQYLLPTLVNITMMTFLLICIFAILGMNLFAEFEIKLQPSYPNYLPIVKSSDENFKDFGSSLILLIQLFTGQNWDRVMYRYSQGTWLAYPYFLSYLIILCFIMANLYLAMVIDGFSESLLENQAIISKSQMLEFLQKWSDYDPNGCGFITFEDLIFLLFELPPPLGFKEDNLRYNFSRNHGIIPL